MGPDSTFFTSAISNDCSCISTLLCACNRLFIFGPVWQYYGAVHRPFPGCRLGFFLSGGGFWVDLGINGANIDSGQWKYIKGYPSSTGPNQHSCRFHVIECVS